jgi:hypothetical protein
VFLYSSSFLGTQCIISSLNVKNKNRTFVRRTRFSGLARCDRRGQIQIRERGARIQPVFCIIEASFTPRAITRP